MKTLICSFQLSYFAANAVHFLNSCVIIKIDMIIIEHHIIKVLDVVRWKNAGYIYDEFFQHFLFYLNFCFGLYFGWLVS